MEAREGQNSPTSRGLQGRGVLRTGGGDTSLGDDPTKHSWQKGPGVYRGQGVPRFQLLTLSFPVLDTISSVYSRLQVDPTPFDPLGNFLSRMW